MKLFLATLLFASQVFSAETESFTRIDDPARKAQYIEAAMTALRGKKFNCIDIKGKQFDGGVGEEVNLAGYSELAVNRGGQPLLVFSESSSDGSQSLSFTSSPDYKSLVSLVYRIWKIERVNTGTLLDPSYSNQRVLSVQSSCSID